MVGRFVRRLFGSVNERRLKAYHARVAEINAQEAAYVSLSDDELRTLTTRFREEITSGKALDDYLVPAFCIVREAAKRVLGQRHFDVQLIGGMVLHDGRIAEMRTGEGKTLVATLPAYLNALTGQGVHVVTVNDYLARRDANWMGRVYRFLGLSVGTIVHGLTDEERRAAYACDITYGTNNEFGFDYLRDNMKYAQNQLVQREHVFAIIDEVDSILIDESRTPLIISGPLEDRGNLYTTIDALMGHLEPDDYEKDEKQKTVSLTEKGNEHIEKLLREAELLREDDLYDISNALLVHHVNQALRAHTLFQRDKDYIVRGGEVVIIDEFTGRMMPGRRYSDGLHQALEAREHVAIQPESQTFASITFQNYFRLYKKLSGMTGTAATEAEEFSSIYNLDIVEIPTHLPLKRRDEDDEVYRTFGEKENAILLEIEEASNRCQPVLVGTTSIERSERLAELLKTKGFTQIDFNKPEALENLFAAARKGESSRLFAVLNARFHEQEAFIIAQAGVPGAITIATNMAGRGTDIQLGGNVDMRLSIAVKEGMTSEQAAQIEASIRQEVSTFRDQALEAGGLYIIGTERHESRRIDNQLRGRSGRQGDPGRSKFFLSLQDDLMRIFGSERMDSLLQRLGLQEGEAIVHPWINKAIEKAQGKVEARNFSIRKNLLKYDDVINDQRRLIFAQRKEFMTQESVRSTIDDLRHRAIERLVDMHCPNTLYPEQWTIPEAMEAASSLFHHEIPLDAWAKEEGITPDIILERLAEVTDALYEERLAKQDPEIQRYVEKQILLQTLDYLWREHIATLDHLRQVVGWRGYAQRDPLNEYKSEALQLFHALIHGMEIQVTRQLFFLEPASMPMEEEPMLPHLEMHRIDPLTGIDLEASQEPHPSGSQDMPYERVGRNAPCPCGSGKKYKHCHGAFALTSV